MTSLEKKLRALANGKDLPWDQTKALLERLGAEVIPPRGGGSHFKIVCKGYSTMYIPVHKGSIKKIYARQKTILLKLALFPKMKAAVTLPAFPCSPVVGVMAKPLRKHTKISWR